MKNLFLITIILGLITSCEEVPPSINYTPSSQLSDTTYIKSPIDSPQLKNVFLEDVSGVRCVNCPDAGLIAKDIVQDFPGRVFVTVLHPDIAALNTLVAPITKPGHESKYDFRTKDAADICQLVGVPGSLPQGYVDRELYPGKTTRLLARTEWYDKCQSQLSDTTPVNISLLNDYDDATRSGIIKVRISYTKLVTDANLLSLILVEDSLVDTQEAQDPNTGNVEYINDYVHMHILRDVITTATGDPLTTDPTITLTPGRTFIKNYRYTLDISDKIKVNPKHAKIIAIINKDATKMDVVQTQEISVLE